MDISESVMLTQFAKRYNTLNDPDRFFFIDTLYNQEHQSYTEIAEKVGTYPNKIIRDAKRLGVQSKTKSESQSQALKSGRHKHPTKGQKREENTKLKISNSLGQSWENLTEDELKEKSETGKRVWKNRSDEDKQRTLENSHRAILEAAKTGSKLEKYLLEQLIENGYKVDFHRSHMMVNEKLHIDIMLPDLNVAIEVDGPSHSEPVWGEGVLARNQRSDNVKTGLVLSQGLVLIRVKYPKTLTQIKKRDRLTKLLDALDKIKHKFPSRENRLFILGDD